MMKIDKFMKKIFSSENDQSSGIRLRQILLSSLFGLTVSILCLCCTTWSWFTGSESTKAATIQTGNYFITVDIEEDDSLIYSNEFEEINNTNNLLTIDNLKSGTSYSITLKGSGNVKNGFCLLDLGQSFYYTPLSPGDTLVFECIPEDNSSITIAWFWGKYDSTQQYGSLNHENRTLLSNGTTIGKSNLQEATKENLNEKSLDDSSSSSEDTLITESVPSENDLQDEETTTESNSVPEEYLPSSNE